MSGLKTLACWTLGSDGSGRVPSFVRAKKPVIRGLHVDVHNVKFLPLCECMNDIS